MASTSVGRSVPLELDHSKNTYVLPQVFIHADSHTSSDWRQAALIDGATASHYVNPKTKIA
jgi:hypothetical protein